MCVKKVIVGRGQSFKWKEGLPLKKNVLKSTSYPLPLASKTSFTNGMDNLREHQLSSVYLFVLKTDHTEAQPLGL
jgi:hypothetical protein